MKNDVTKERWVNDVMGSLEGISRAEAPGDIFEKVNLELSSPQIAKVAPLYPKQWAAAAILLLALNIGSVVYYAEKHSNTTAAGSNPFAMEMQSETTYNY